MFDGSELEKVSRRELDKAAKGIQTINRFIKLLNGMPERIRQEFYRKMAAKITEDEGVLKKYHVHIYRISGKLELTTLAPTEKEAKKGALEVADKDTFSFGKSDCKHIAIAFLAEEEKDND